MVMADKMAAVLSDFARTLITDFPIQGILDQLVERIVEVVPVTSAGVTLISAGTAPHYVAASDRFALRYERLQTGLREGPCLAAYESGEAVAVPDVRTDERFLTFGPAAADAGMGAVFAFPLRHGDSRLGALDLYRNTPGPLDAQDMEAAQTLADVAAAYLLNATARREALEASDVYRHNAMHDPLTGLPNRLLLQQRLEHAVQRARRSHSSAAILFADLDRFKHVNDIHGHRVGDDLLLAVSRRLSRLVRPGDTLARVSGDEFVFLCEDLRHPEDVENLARRIDDAFTKPFVLGSIRLSVNISIGVAFAGPGEEVSDELVVKADAAMYQAKRRKRTGHHIIDLRPALRANDGESLDQDLRAAFDAEELDVVYQPIVRTTDGMMTGVEALLRWTHPKRGAVPPMSLVGIAERMGWIGEIGAWVLERSCQDRSRWLHQHPEMPIDLAVNVSGAQLLDPGFQTTVAEALSRSGMGPGALVLELTENIFIDDRDPAMAALAELRALGIRLALDDFGTGYSSLSYLRRLPVQIVKIDQSFVSDIGKTPTAGAILAAVTDLSHVLGLTVTAEGVETERQRDDVRSLGCESAQGYFYAEPVSAAAIASMLDGLTSSGVYLPASQDLANAS